MASRQGKILGALGILLGVASGWMLGECIWTGDLRWFGTAFVLMPPAFILCLVAAFRI